MPLTIALAAVAVVKQIRDGCELFRQAQEGYTELKETYDDVVGTVNEVKGILGPILGPIIAWFRKKPEPKKPAAAAEAAAKRSAKKTKSVQLDETKIKADIVKSISEFFVLQEKLEAKIREEERKSKTEYDPNQNHNIAAMNRVLALQEMSKLETEIREIMVYQTPGLGDLYTQTFKMRAVIKKEQEQARKKQEANEKYRKQQEEREELRIRMRLAVLVAAVFIVLYAHIWLALLRSRTTPSI